MLPIKRRYLQTAPDISFLELADFDHFNKTYSQVDPCRCPSCRGAGYHSSQELQGDPPMTGWVTVTEPCDRCIGHELCPGCMSPIALSFDPSGFSPPDTAPSNPTMTGVMYQWDYVRSDWATFQINVPTYLTFEDIMSGFPHNGFTCLVCGWTRDFVLTSPDYLEWDEVDWGEGEDDGDGWHQRPIPDEFQP